MDSPNQEDAPPSPTEPFPSFFSSDWSQPTTDTQSEKSSTNDQRTLASESPPDLTYNYACHGRSTGCYYPEDGQPHCHLRCPPRACKQCREVLDADWVDNGRWLEDCISLEEEDEVEQPGGGGGVGSIPLRLLSKKAVAMTAFAVSVAGILCCAWHARANWGLLQEWAAAWAQL